MLSSRTSTSEWRTSGRPRRKLTALLVSGATLLGGGLAAAAAPAEGHARIAGLMDENERVRRTALRALSRDVQASRGLVPGMVDAIFFTPKRHRAELLSALRRIAAHDAGDDFYSWIEWIGAHPELAPAPGYATWKRDLFSKIDPRYGTVLDPEAARRLRLEEVVFGGARLDGIPALDDPPSIPAAEASVLTDAELVFGVELGGEARAYPHRYLSWHEMANDIVGGVPIVLSY